MTNCNTAFFNSIKIEKLFIFALAIAILFAFAPGATYADHSTIKRIQPAGVTGFGVKVCIVDTGVDDSHPALKPLVAEYDFANNDNDATDGYGHGTHIAGIIASQNAAYKGVAQGVSLMAAKVLDDSGFGRVSDIIAGMKWCADNGADIISVALSIGTYEGACDSLPISRLSNDLADQGISIFAATGNLGYTDRISAPACASNVIAVGAVDKNDGRLPYVNVSGEVDVVAPGSKITSTYLKGTFVALSGSSMATAYAAAAGALLLEADPSLTPKEVGDILRNTAVDLGDAGFDPIYGYGRVDAYSAYKSLSDLDIQGTEAVNLGFVLPDERIYPGDIFTVEIRLDSKDVSINALEAGIVYPSDTIEIVSIERTGSILSLWPKDPAFSNLFGLAFLTGGVPTPGFRDDNGLVGTIYFLAKDAGTVNISFSPASRVLRNDGFGSEAFLVSNDARFDISTFPDRRIEL